MQGVLIKSPLTLNNDEVAKPVTLYKNHSQLGRFYSRKTDHSKRCMQAKPDGGIEPNISICFADIHKEKRKNKITILISDLIFYVK